MEELKAKWEEIKELLKIEHQIVNVSYKTWIQPLKPISIEGNVLTISVPDDVARGAGVDFINKKYGKSLMVCIAEITDKEYELVFKSESEVNAGVSSYINASENSEGIIEDNNLKKAKEANLNPKYTFDKFVIGENNSLAHAASLAVAEAPGLSYNPLFIWGGSGLGKTHLMHSIGHHIINNNPNMNVLYVTSQQFVDELVDAIQKKKISSFKEKYKNIDVIMIDDIQFIAGKITSQEEFFHIFNQLHMQQKAIVITSDRPPKEIEALEERLRSRFEGGLITDIQPPKYETRVAILRKKIESLNQQIDVDNDIINYIATNVNSNIRDLEGALNKVLFYSKLNKSNVTLEIVEDALRDIIKPSSSRQITPQLIIETVANYYNISKEDILSSKRKQEIVFPRHIVMYLCSVMTQLNTVSIGNAVGGKNHSTVIHSCKLIENQIKEDESLSNTIEAIKKMINPI